MQKSKGLLNERFDFMEKKLLKELNSADDKLYIVKEKLKLFRFQFKKKWSRSYYHKKAFQRMHSKWLDGLLSFPMSKTTRTLGAGRPRKDFFVSSDRSKRRKTQTLREHVPVEELTYATQMSLRANASEPPETLRLLQSLKK